MESTLATPAAGAVPAPATTTWTIDPVHSTVEFAVKHMMVSTTRGRFTGVTGTIVLDEDDLTRSHAEVEIDAATVDTRDERRDGHLRSADFLEVETYPTITFKSARVRLEGTERARVFGDLTIRGVTREVVLDTELNGRNKSPWGAEVIGFTATTKISRKDFGLSYNPVLETGGFVVGDEVKIQLEIEATKQD
jgi:polyisoprenoid-binding protein YceI